MCDKYLICCIACDIAFIAFIACDRMRSQSSWLYVTRLLTATMRSHAIACDLEKNLSFTTVQVLKIYQEREAGQKVCLKCFFMTNVNRFHFFFGFLKKEEMRSGTHFTQQSVFLLFTVVVTKYVWPYFQSRFPKTSSDVFLPEPLDAAIGRVPASCCPGGHHGGQIC